MKFFQQLSLSSGIVMALALAGCAQEAAAPAQAEDVSALSCPFGLDSEDSSALDPSITSFNARARSGYTWCRIADVAQYTTPACSTNVTFPDIIDELSRFDPILRGFSFADGEELTASEIATIEPFTTWCSPGGPGVASAVNANVSSSAVQGWLLVSEIPCHNCHEFARVYVLWYPADRQVLVVPYVTGYDS